MSENKVVALGVAVLDVRELHAQPRGLCGVAGGAMSEIHYECKGCAQVYRCECCGIVEGRNRPPTEAEIMALARAGGGERGWLRQYPGAAPEYVPSLDAVALRVWEDIDGAKWWAWAGGPVAWPEVGA